MARERLKAAARKALERAAAAQLSEAEEVAAGVLATARQTAPLIRAGSLYWTAPFQYVAEQMAPRVCRHYDLAPERVDDVAAYLLANLNEFVVKVVEHFDVEHFERWTAAAERLEAAPATEVANG